MSSIKSPPELASSFCENEIWIWSRSGSCVIQRCNVPVSTPLFGFTVLKSIDNWFKVAFNLLVADILNRLCMRKRKSKWQSSCSPTFSTSHYCCSRSRFDIRFRYWWKSSSRWTNSLSKADVTWATADARSDILISRYIRQSSMKHIFMFLTRILIGSTTSQSFSRKCLSNQNLGPYLSLVAVSWCLDLHQLIGIYGPPKLPKTREAKFMRLSGQTEGE